MFEDVIEDWRFGFVCDIGKTRREFKGLFVMRKFSVWTGGCAAYFLMRVTSPEHGLAAGLILAHGGFATGRLGPEKEVQILIDNRRR